MLRVATASLLVLLAGLVDFAGAGPLTLVSRADPARPSDTAGGPSRAVALSADGRYTVYRSNAANLVPGVTDLNGLNDYYSNEGSDLFLYDGIAGTTVLVSHAAGDLDTTADAPSLDASISADGRWVAFTSYAGNLVAGQIEPYPTGTLDVFLYDRVSGAVALVSHEAGSALAAMEGDFPEISADGRRIAYLSNSNAYLYDRTTGANTLISHLAGSTTPAYNVSEVAISSNGNRVAFVCTAVGIVEGEIGDESEAADVYLYNHATGGTILVSHAAGAAATQADATSFEPVLSDDGRFVAYASYSSNLVHGQHRESYDPNVFLYDRASGASVLVSHTASSATASGEGYSRRPSLSADGRWVAFHSSVPNLAGEDPEYRSDVFLYDRTTRANTRVSRSNGDSFEPHLSADGSAIVFWSNATDLVPGQTDSNLRPDLFLWTRASGAVALVTHAEGSPTTAAFTNVTSFPDADFLISADGSRVALTSTAIDLVSGFDANAAGDAFLYERASGINTLLSARGAEVSASAGGSLGGSLGRALSNDGRYIAFASRAPNAAPQVTDANDASDVFLHDRITGLSTLVSHASGSSAIAGGGESHAPLISTDGSSLLFLSEADDLAPGQTETLPEQLFFYDRASQALTLVSHAAGSPSPAADGRIPRGEYALSADGRWAAYASAATDLAAGQSEANFNTDVFLWDRATGENVLVSHASGSPLQTGDDRSLHPEISADGRYVVFESDADDLVPGPVNRGGLYLYDRVAETTTRIAVHGENPAISADGRWVAFSSRFTGVVPGQTGYADTGDVFLWDRVSGQTILASHTPGSPAVGGDHISDFPVLSADGRWLVFQSLATNLVAGQSDHGFPSWDVFLFERAGGTVKLLSHAYGSPVEAAGGENATISADGRFVGFSSYATGLLPGQDRIFSDDQFLYDRLSGTLSLITHTSDPAAASGTGNRHRPQLSADGAWAVFESQSPDHVPGDLDAVPDVFLHANPLGRDFFTVTPCRLVDTRQQGPALTSGLKRTFQVSGACGLPATARAVAANVTAVQPSGPGHLTLHPGDAAAPLASAVSFSAGAIRTGNAVLSLAFDGTGTLSVTPLVAGGGTVHLILDVSGWFE